MGQPSQRLAARAHPLLVDGAVGGHTTCHPDVLPRRPAVRLRPHLSIRAATRPGTTDRDLRPFGHRGELGTRISVGHRAPRHGSNAVTALAAGALRQTPSQTVGPYFTMRLSAEGENVLTSPESTGQRIRIVGRVLDGDRKHIEDALIELWQADSNGRYHHPADDRTDVPADPAFT